MSMTEPTLAEGVTCRQCGGSEVTVSIWESSDGGHEDKKYRCADRTCSFYWWIEGPDA